MMDEKEARRMAVTEQTLVGKFKSAGCGLAAAVCTEKRLKAKGRKGGAAAILHGNRGRKPHQFLWEEKAFPNTWA